MKLTDNQSYGMMHQHEGEFKKGDRVDFRIKGSGGKSKIYHGTVTSWDSFGFSFADCGKNGKSVWFGTSNVIKHRVKDPTELDAYTYYDGKRWYHFHHGESLLEFCAKIHIVPSDTKIHHYDKEMALESGFAYED